MRVIRYTPCLGQGVGRLYFDIINTHRWDNIVPSKNERRVVDEIVDVVEIVCTLYDRFRKPQSNGGREEEGETLRWK